MTAEPAPAQSFAHRGRFFNVLGLAAKNAVLTLLTLTLYRFWARTSMRRRLWSRTWIMGDALEYTGTAWELFRGFLIALPTFFLPTIFIINIAPVALDPNLAGWLLIGFYILVVPLLAAARYLMRRYQLSRTRWRGIRLGLAGSALAFAFASWGWTILQLVSLGWYTPVSRMNRARYLWQNTRFGDQPFDVIKDGRSPQHGLWWPFALGWFGFIAATFTALIAMGIVVAMFGFSGGVDLGAGGEANETMIFAGVAAMLTGALVFLLTLAAFWTPYNAAAMNRIAALLELDGARFRLRVKTIPLFFITLAGWAITAFSLGLLAPFAGFLQVRYVMNRLEMIGQPRFAEIGQAIVPEQKSGEALGEAFDLDMGVGVI
ncbi:MAG TPA: DUF898 family protein [Terricaulis sp.]|nr:DUF898 family protein [Terricaulis sp.]HRP09598.1 DUF898 family protein [Terricaulis sp.]